MSLLIAVYTIALNEARHVGRWAQSVEDADYRVVADTGSTDGTPMLLRAAGVAVHELAIRPWRFDDARNASLALLPRDADICIMLDMDNFMTPGWRAAVEAAWTPQATRLHHRLQVNFHAVGTPVLDFENARIHARWHYRWKRPVHELLVPAGKPEVHVHAPNVIMAEIKDGAKETRANYLPLLELAVEEEPLDSQLCFWLGRELHWSGRKQRAAEVFKRFLALPTSNWGPERTEAMIHLAQAEPEKRKEWLEKSVVETPSRREVWLELAESYHDEQDWLNLYWACASGVQRGHRTGSYLDREQAWGSRLLDLGALACWHLGVGHKAVEWGEKALRLSPTDERLRNNLTVFKRDAKLQI